MLQQVIEQTDRRPAVSVVAPAKDEAGNLDEFVNRCLIAFAQLGIDGEIVIVDDGSVDGTGAVLQSLVDAHPTVVRGLSHRRNLGLTAALKTAFAHATGDIILWLSPDLESLPDEDIPILMSGFAEGAKVVAGARLGRGDGKGAASSVYNWVCWRLFGLKLRDMNWIKGFHRECLPFLHLRGDWHRFILVMLHLAGFSLVERDTHWHSRKYGQSKFGLMRFPRAFIDALSIWFLLRFSGKPMRLFGSVGLGLGLTGVLTHLALTVMFLAGAGQLRPLFWLALGAELAAVMLIMFGFVAEQIERLRDEVEDLRAGNSQPPHWATTLKPLNGGEVRR